MVFHSATFLFAFLPACAVLWLAARGARAKELLLGLASVVFIAFGGLAQLPVMLFAVAWNTLFGVLLRPGAPRRRLWKAVGVAGDLLLLGVYKYLDFLLSTLGLPAVTAGWAAPLGISFFTFHGISYLIDVYRGKAPAERDPVKLFLYLAFFPKLLAGPIVQYRDAVQSCARAVPPEDFAAGLRRFTAGMAKKLLLAESAAAVADAVWALPSASLGTGLAWAGAAAYCLQIFFDFSGYSDMAIGLAKLFGYTLPENFDHPYVSRTVSEFWRRWHMSLNRWFIEYVYIPLGGSRGGEAKTVRNKLIVFLLTGIWHGAGWTFILWGLWHGVFVALEGLVKAPLERLRRALPGRALLRVYTLLVVLLGFVMFRSASVGQGFAMIGKLFCFNGAGAAGVTAVERIFTPARIVFLLLGVLFSTEIPAVLAKKLERAAEGRPAAPELAKDVLALLCLGLCVLALSGGSFSPFIYQQF